MSLAIAFKGPEGIVLAADSRVTLAAQNQQTKEVIQVAYDNATKLLQVPGQAFVGAVIYGQAALGGTSPRPIHSYMPELEESLRNEERLSVKEFAIRLGAFFAEQWEATMPKDAKGNVVFLVAGYNDGEPYGRVYEVKVPSNPKPTEQNAGNESFGLTFGGQGEIVNRLLAGMEPRLINVVKDSLKLDEKETGKVATKLSQTFQMPIPYQFLPLQDCVDLSILLVRTTMDLMGFIVGARGVGGPIDVAVVTRTEGFRAVKQKKISGDNPR